MYMNNFRRFIVLIGLTFTLLVGCFTAPVFAQGTPAQQDASTAIAVTHPSKFVLSEVNGTTITYSKGSKDSPAELDYKAQNIDKKFTGQEIDTQEINGVGTLVTVTIEQPIKSAIIGKYTLLSVLLPEVNLLIGGEDSVKTKAILTTERTSRGIGFPLLGQIQTYEILSLQGTASA